MPLGLAGIFGGIAIVIAIVLPIAALVPVGLAYVALRVRDARDAEPDPKLGIKTAFHTIHTTAILMILSGATIFTVDLMDGAFVPKPAGFAPLPKPDGPNAAQRTAGAIVGSGLLFAIVFWALLMGTNDSTHKSVRRVFGGGRMALCLLVTMFTLTGLLVNLVQKNPEHSLTEALVAILIVWLPAAIIHIVFFIHATAGPRYRRSSRYEEDAD